MAAENSRQGKPPPEESYTAPEDNRRPPYFGETEPISHRLTSIFGPADRVVPDAVLAVDTSPAAISTGGTLIGNLWQNGRRPRTIWKWVVVAGPGRTGRPSARDLSRGEAEKRIPADVAAGERKSLKAYGNEISECLRTVHGQSVKPGTVEDHIRDIWQRYP